MPASGQALARGEDGPNGGLVVLPRVSGPPLRMRAQAVAEHAIDTAEGEVLRVTLWARPNGQFAVSFTRPGAAGPVPDAAQGPDCDALAAGLEDLCQSLAAPPPIPHPLSLAEAVALQHRRMREHDFLRLVGWALADWERGGALARTA